MMTKLFGILFVLGMFALPTYSDAGGPPERYWLCSQVGHIKKTNVFAISDVFVSDPNQYEEKQEAFTYAVEEQEKRFEPSYEARCQEYTSRKKAQKNLKKTVGKAVKKKFSILSINFSYYSK